MSNRPLFSKVDGGILNLSIGIDYLKDMLQTGRFPAFAEPTEIGGEIFRIGLYAKKGHVEIFIQKLVDLSKINKPIFPLNELVP